MPDDNKTLTIPVPRVAPLGVQIETAAAVHEVWDVFVKPQQDRGEIQSVEDRLLMAILRAVHEGLNRVTPCEKCSAEALT